MQSNLYCCDLQMVTSYYILYQQFQAAPNLPPPPIFSR